MTLKSALLMVSLPPLIISILGTILTIFSFWYRRDIARAYFQVRERWHKKRDSLPRWLIVVLRIIFGTVGVGLVIFGLVLIPLPGPGAIVVMSGAGLLDLEFGWIVPALRTILDYCPERMKPDALSKGVEKLRKEPDAKIRKP